MCTAFPTEHLQVPPAGHRDPQALGGVRLAYGAVEAGLGASLTLPRTLGLTTCVGRAGTWPSKIRVLRPRGRIYQWVDPRVDQESQKQDPEVSVGKGKYGLRR